MFDPMSRSHFAFDGFNNLKEFGRQKLVQMFREVDSVSFVRGRPEVRPRVQNQALLTMTMPCLILDPAAAECSRCFLRVLCCRL